MIEILSPDDSFSRVLRQCGLYGKLGIRQIAVADPKVRLIWRFENGAPQETDVVARRGDATIPAQTLWHEVGRGLWRTSAKSRNIPRMP